MAPLKDVKCAITGKPAKYRDPLTGLPYYDLAAFKVIREQHSSAAAASDREKDGKQGGGVQGDGGPSMKRRREEQEEELEDELMLSQEQLDAVVCDDAVRELLKDSALREMVRDVDGAEDRVRALDTMRGKYAKFNHLMVTVLEKLEPA
mmetsp:Transcript_578/g.1395  ORF Transcript_578/g.1395 Transcript_578/m.1395 type:complete len:149 (+) Transcript_578:129-575(+)